MEHGRPLPAANDGAVADPVALHPGTPSEDALEDSLRHRSVVGESTRDILEPTHRGVDSILELRDLPVVLGQPQLREDLGEPDVGVEVGAGAIAPGKQLGVEYGVVPAQHPAQAAARW